MTEPASALLDEPAGVLALRSRAGFSVSETAAAAEISGLDRARFLQSQLPVDVEALAEGHGAYTAYLDRRGRITADLVVLRAEESLLVLIAPERLAATLESFERHHFREEVTLRDRSRDLAVWELHGPSTPAVLSRLCGQRAPIEPYRHQRFTVSGADAGEPVDVRWIADPWTGDVGGRLIVPREHAALVRASLVEAGRPEGLAEIGPAALEILRIEGGRPRSGADIDERTLLLELGRDEMVSFNKGCYLGQETVARVHARGHVNRLLMGLLVEGGDVPATGALVHLGDVPAGETRSACWSPSLGPADRAGLASPRGRRAGHGGARARGLGARCGDGDRAAALPSPGSGRTGRERTIVAAWRTSRPTASKRPSPSSSGPPS